MGSFLCLKDIEKKSSIAAAVVIITVEVFRTNSFLFLNELW
jgi:hypothetical protein